MILAQRTVAWLSTDATPYITGSVLDVGCGAKPYKRMFPDCEWTGVDARPVGDIECDMDKLALEAEYDTVLCTDALQYSRNPTLAVYNMANALKSGGHLIIVAPNCWHDDLTSRWRFTIGGLGAIASDIGLEIVHLDGLQGLWAANAGALRNSFEYMSTLPAEFDGWIGELERSYPMLTALIAKKP